MSHPFVSYQFGQHSNGPFPSSEKWELRLLGGIPLGDGVSWNHSE